MKWFLVALLGLSRLVLAGDSRQDWKTVESEHFIVHYYEPNGDVGRRVAVVAEAAHRTLTAALAHAPAEKTHIVVGDNSDGANGFAMSSPRNFIFLYATAPEGMSVLSDHDDWLYELVAHEYTHIIHIDTTSGIPSLYNSVFGKTWLPNQVQPRWFIEGLATYEESKRSAGGRLRNALFDMFLRMAVLSGRPLPLDQVSAGPLFWPHGNAIYLYGSPFLHYIADRYGDDKLAAISHDYGSHIIPWNLGRAVRRAIGKNFDELYADWLASLREKYALQKAAVLRRPLISGRRLTRLGESNSSPRYAPGGNAILWTSSDGHNRPRVLSLSNGNPHEVTTLEGIVGFSPLPDGSLVLARSKNFRTQYDFHDLDLLATNGEVVSLTHGARASDPEVSPDGNRVAFTVNASSKLRLAVMPMKPGAAYEVVWEGPGRWDQVYSPHWSPDGTQIAFSLWSQGGYRDILVLDLASHTTRAITHDRALDGDPHWSPDGLWLYFVSDRNGIHNVYATELETGAVKQITNVLGGALGFDLSPDGRRIVYSGYDETGFDLYELEVDPTQALDAELYIDDRPPAVHVGDDQVVVTEPRAYRSVETLGPRSWNAAAGFDSFGNAVALSTSGSDIAGFHSYSLGVNFGETRGDVNFGAGYSYGRLWPGLYGGVGRSIGRAGGLILDGRNTAYTEETWSASIGITLPVLRVPSLSADLGFGYDIDWERNVDGKLPQDPQMLVPVAPEIGIEAGMGMRVTLSNLYRFSYSLGPQLGRSLSFGLRVNDPSLGSDFQRVELSYRWQEFWRTPFRDHGFNVRLAGGLFSTNRRRSGFYSLGGAPKQLIFPSIIDSIRTGSTGVLRGYPAGLLYGRQYHLLNAEYRLPLWDIEKGYSTLPLFVRRLHFAALFDAGNATLDDFDASETRVSVGASLRLATVFGFFADGTFDLGIAKGLMNDGVTDSWFLLTQSL